MSTTDSNGIVFLEETDIIAPFHTLINSLQSGTSAAVKQARRGPIYAPDDATRATLLTEYGSSSTSPLWVDVAGVLWRHNGSTWQKVASAYQEASIGFRSPSVWGPPGTDELPMFVSKHLDIATLHAGYIRTNASLGMGLNQIIPAITIPAGYRPAKNVSVSGGWSVDGVTMHFGRLLIETNGNCDVQTTTSFGTAPAGAVRFFLNGAASWKVGG